MATQRTRLYNLAPCCNCAMTFSISFSSLSIQGLVNLICVLFFFCTNVYTTGFLYFSSCREANMSQYRSLNQSQWCRNLSQNLRESLRLLPHLLLKKKNPGLRQDHQRKVRSCLVWYSNVCSDLIFSFSLFEIMWQSVSALYLTSWPC